jgi:hypothetical protein
MKLVSIMARSLIIVISVVLSPLNASSYGPFTVQAFRLGQLLSWLLMNLSLLRPARAGSRRKARMLRSHTA